MNSVTAVLLAVALIAVVLLVVWLVLRSRSSDLPRGSMAYGSGAPSEQSASDPDPAPAHEDKGVRALADPVTPTQQDDDTLTPEGETAAGPEADGDAALAEEYVEPGLSELGPEPSRESDDGVVSGGAPRTTAQAFGSAQASGDPAAHEAATREGSVLDDPDVDSTPLFRSIREELLGSSTSEVADQEAETVDDALAADVVAEQPEVDVTWSQERRGWDEQAPADTTGVLEGSVEGADSASIEAQENVWRETVTEGVVETGAVGTGSVGPAAEEEELLETSQDTTVEVEEADAVAPHGEHPPIRRISELHEVVDGGFGIGSATTIDDGAQPLGHPIKANVDTKTYQDLHSPWYDETEPDVWFLDAGFAERAGFRRAE